MTAKDDTRGRFDGKTALVTGSTKGIGRGIAKRLAAEGAAVVVTGRSVDAGERVVETIRDAGGEATFVRADLRRPAEIERLVTETVDQYERIDVLVNNAAVQTETAADEATLADWNLVIETDFRSYWLCSKYALKGMEKGAIVNVSSNHALLTIPRLFPYNAVKAGIDGMTRAMALDFGPQVRVNAVNPGYVVVERNEAALSDRDRLDAIHPAGRVGTPEDIAASVSFLASDEAAFITGTNLVVDGGRSAVMEDDTLFSD